ncbi:MAG: hypothetical protein JST30_03220 [Armatimonadetes bacterium]|nr:hypothetical protein [Armatimonadota bacterium]
MSKRILVPLAFLFFLGFPAVGLVWVWNDAHARLRRSAEPEARILVEKALQATKVEDFDVLSTNVYIKSGGPAAVLKARAEHGGLKSVGTLSYVRSYAGSRSDMVWQFVEFKGPVTFDKGGEVQVRATLGRHSINVVWLLDKLEIDR